MSCRELREEMDRNKNTEEAKVPLELEIEESTELMTFTYVGFCVDMELSYMVAFPIYKICGLCSNIHLISRLEVLLSAWLGSP